MHSLPSGVEVKNAWLYTSILEWHYDTVSTRPALIKGRNFKNVYGPARRMKK